MLANRVEGTYKPFDQSKLPRDNYERIYATHSPVEENLGYAKFDIRSPAQSHMSTVAYLERTLEFRLELRQRYVLPKVWRPMAFDDEADGDLLLATTPRGPVMMINSPGFALQNCMKRSTMIFQDCTVTDKPSEWLPMYSHLYQKSLRSHIRGSDRLQFEIKCII